MTPFSAFIPTGSPLALQAKSPPPLPKDPGPVNPVYTPSVEDGPVNIAPESGEIKAAAPEGKLKPRPVRSIGPLPVATTSVPSCVSVTTYPACAGGAARPQPTSIAMPSAAANGNRIPSMTFLRFGSPRWGVGQIEAVAILRRERISAPSPAKPVSKRAQAEGSGTGAPMSSVKFWFAPVPHVHSYLPGVTPRVAKVWPA